MKPAPFEYERAADLASALSALARYGSEAKVLAGGQSLPSQKIAKGEAEPPDSYAHDCGDRRFARTALVLRASGYEDRRIKRD